jgi:hypothetical protein
MAHGHPPNVLYHALDAIPIVDESSDDDSETLDAWTPTASTAGDEPRSVCSDPDIFQQNQKGRKSNTFCVLSHSTLVQRVLRPFCATWGKQEVTFMEISSST